MVTVGIDVGSTATKVAVVSEGRILAATKVPTGSDPAASASRCLDEALENCGLQRKDVCAIVTTGYGRDLIAQRSGSVTEITCHARGVSALVPGARTVVDIGGQDSKVIRLDQAGLLSDFVMNDKCAAGTGRFLEVMANRLGIRLEDFEREWNEAPYASKISSTCTVFAESEVISLISQGVPVSSVVKGLCDAIASRIASMGRRVGMEKPVVLTGGVSLNGGVKRSLEKTLATTIVVPPWSVFMGAYGAALIASNMASK